MPKVRYTFSLNLNFRKLTSTRVSKLLSAGIGIDLHQFLLPANFRMLPAWASSLNLSTALSWKLDDSQQRAKVKVAILSDGVVIVDGSGFPKDGRHSVGVARQYCGHLGKIANCQEGVFLVYAGRQGYAFLDERLYVPEQWFNADSSVIYGTVCVKNTCITSAALGSGLWRNWPPLLGLAFLYF